MTVIRIFLLLFCTAAIAFGAPAYRLEELLPRAKYVVVVAITSRTSTTATFQVLQIWRGDDIPKKLVLSHTHAENEFPKDTDRLLLFSQGDDFHGPPMAEFRIGQPIKGQASYRGWILGEADVRSPEGQKRVVELMEHAPYRADIYDKKSNKAAELTRTSLRLVLVAHLESVIWPDCRYDGGPGGQKFGCLGCGRRL
jgi:hypothetical protein